MPIPPDDPVWIPATFPNPALTGAPWTLSVFGAVWTTQTRVGLVWLPDPAVAPTLGKQGYWGILVADTS